MKLIQGVRVSSGVAIGPVFIYKRQEFQIPEYKAENPDNELKRFYEAVDESKNEISEQQNSIENSLSKEDKEILDSHLAMLDDPELLNLVKSHITLRRTNAEMALKIASEHFICLLEDVDDDYLKGRAKDIRDISDRILKFLLDISSDEYSKLLIPSIIVADELTVNDIVGFNKENILGIITSMGGVTDHSAIMAKSYGIPMITGVKNIYEEIQTAKDLILVGREGKVYIDANKDILCKAQNLKKKEEELKLIAGENAHRHAITSDEHRVNIYANIGSIDNAKKAINNGAEGIGLFRTELLFIDNNELLDEDTQFKHYLKVANIFKGKEIIIRTLDIGGDKQIRSLKLEDEDNPALGLRALRLMFTKVDELLKPQLKAILRLSESRKVKIMLPMVSSISEVRKFKEIMVTCQEELDIDSNVINNIQIGIMIEIPSSAILAEMFAKEVDFFSIGTNDLTQYTLSADRTNSDVSYLNQGMHPAVLHLINQVVKSAYKRGKPVGVCGELATDRNAIPILVGLGIDELSVNPVAIPIVKEMIRKLSYEECRTVAEKALELDNWKDIKNMTENIIFNEI